MNIAKVLLLLGSGGAFVFLAASCGGNSWLTTSTISQGLFKFCGKTTDICYSFGSNVNSSFQATRAFAVMSVLAAAAGGLLAFLGLITEKVKGIFASVMLFGAALCMIISLAIFTNDANDGVKANLADYGWSYILGWIGVVGALTAGVIGIFAK